MCRKHHHESFNAVFGLTFFPSVGVFSISFLMDINLDCTWTAKQHNKNEQKICAANILLSETGINSPPLDSVYTPTSAWHN